MLVSCDGAGSLRSWPERLGVGRRAIRRQKVLKPEGGRSRAIVSRGLADSISDMLLCVELGAWDPGLGSTLEP